MQRNVKQLADDLKKAIQPRGRMLTAYSGGIDSTLVAVAARRVLGKVNAPAVIGDSASLPRFELNDARNLATQLDLNLIEINPGEQEDENYRANAGNRCYFCKSHLYAALQKLAEEMDFPFIANGTNSDDLGDHRPGLEAAKESRVVSPLLDAGFTKADVRSLANHWSLPNADKPAAACLASRIPYGTAVTAERLAMVEQAEQSLRDLGFEGFRVRHHENVARIELPIEQLHRMMEPEVREQVVQSVKAAGYLYVSLDLAGFASGSGNAVLTIGKSGVS